MRTYETTMTLNVTFEVDDKGRVGLRAIEECLPYIYWDVSWKTPPQKGLLDLDEKLSAIAQAEYDKEIGK